MLDSKKVFDHHAVIPTVRIKKADLSALSGEEQKILLLVSSQLLCVTGEKHLYETVKVELSCNGNTFTATGRTVTHNGWKDFKDMLKHACKMEAGTNNGNMEGGSMAEENEVSGDTRKEGKLPELTEGQVFEKVQADISEHVTSAPKHYTEDQLLLPWRLQGKGSLKGKRRKKGLVLRLQRQGLLKSWCFRAMRKGIREFSNLSQRGHYGNL